MRTSNKVLFALDAVEPVAPDADEYFLEGWFVPNKDADTGDRLAVMVDGVAVPVFMGRSRPDVANHLGDPGATNCGFVARFKAPRGDNNVRLVAQTSNGEVVLANMTLDARPGLKTPKTPDRRGVSTYRDWLGKREPALFWPEDEIADRLSVLTYQPLVSIILPTYNTDLYFLERCVHSVLEQHYAHWQLCVADDSSSGGRVIEYLRSIAAQDPRVVVTVRKSNGGISAASNTALETAKGDFVVLLDHDDELHPFALLEVVRSLNTNEKADLIYSDEDKIDSIGRRSHPAFKPDFDMDMFLSFDYLGHLVALRRSLVSRIGGFRSACDGSQDWDLLIRAVEVIGPSRVDHIAKPLYHWRMHEDSTAFDLYSKPYARHAWARVISEHIERMGKKASAEPGLFYGSTRIRYKRPKDIGVAVFVRADDGPLQAAAIGADVDLRSTGLYELVNCAVRPLRVTLDGARGDSSLASQDSTTRGTEAHGPAVSSFSLPIRSLSEIPGDVFVFINRPIEGVNHAFFDELAAQAMRPECGLVTGISLDSDSRTAHTGLIGGRDGELMDPFAGITFSHHGYMGQLSVIRSVEAIGDYFFAVRREHLSDVGGLGAVSGAHMPRLVHRLIGNARKNGLLILVTPYAVATFAGEVPATAIEPLESNRPSGVSINPNLMAFQHLEHVLKGNI